MDNADTFGGGSLAGGDKAIPPPETGLKRDQDSVDDFEHLGGETSRREEFGASPFHDRKMTTQSFLDTEREEMFVQPARAELAASNQPLVGTLIDKVVDHVADKFTDSDSDADTAGESPLHRPESARVDHARSPPVAPLDPTPVLAPLDPTPVLAPRPAPEPPKPIPSAPIDLKFDLKGESAPKSVIHPFEKEISPPIPAPEPLKPKPIVEPAPIKHEPAVPLKPEPVPSKSEPVPSRPEPVRSKPEPAISAKAEPSPTLEPSRSPTAHVIEAEVIFCQMGLDAWFDPQRLHPKVESLMYWREPARSGVALGAGLALLVALACCSVVSVLAYGSLLLLVAAVAFRVYKNVLQAVQKTNEGHPFKWLLEKDISIPAERAQASAAAATAHLNAVAAELRRLFLVEDLVDSLKFGVLLWCLTYVGACFNGITLIILGWIALFTLPKAYEMNKAQVDANLDLARTKINEISAKVRAAVPLGRKSESDKDK